MSQKVRFKSCWRADISFLFPCVHFYCDDIFQLWLSLSLYFSEKVFNLQLLFIFTRIFFNLWKKTITHININFKLISGHKVFYLSPSRGSSIHGFTPNSVVVIILALHFCLTCTYLWRLLWQRVWVAKTHTKNVPIVGQMRDMSFT